MSSRHTSPVTRHASPPFELSGPPGAPLIVVLGGISATRHVTATSSDPRDGWWQAQVGPGLAIDTRTHRVLGFDWTTATPGSVTTHDQANRIHRSTLRWRKGARPATWASHAPRHDRWRE